MIEITRHQARQFLLLRHGLMGEPRFIGKQGVLDFIRQAGCIQFDPINVCGMNAELVLQARVKDFTKSMLTELLYQDRKLVDYFDKNLSIFPLEDWPYFSATRADYKIHTRALKTIEPTFDGIRRTLAENGPLSSAELELKDKVDWYWSQTNTARAALETLYFQGELIVHHKQGTRKFYGLAQDYLPAEILAQPDPFPTPAARYRWHVLRRIGAVGLLWNKASDAWLGINGLKAAERNEAFQSLTESGEIFEIGIQDAKEHFFLKQTDLPLLETVLNGVDPQPHTALIAPLDNLLWDRKLIRFFFDFDYRWEVYSVPAQRKYGYYVLPILQGERFIGRCEPSWDKKQHTLDMQRIWLEADNVDDQALQACFERFARFHESTLLH